MNIAEVNTLVDQLPAEVRDQENFFSEQEELSLYKQIANLNLRIDESCPTLQLSEDVLQYIFMLLVHDPTRLIDDWDSMSICHVCHRWRVIAMNTGAVWSNLIIFYVSKERIERYLDLSKNAKLVVTIKNSCFRGRLCFTVGNLDKIRDMLHSLELHRERVVELKVFGFFEGAWSDVLALVQGPVAGHLHRLDIRMSSGRPSEIARMFRTDYIIPALKLPDRILLSNLLTNINLSSLVLESLPNENLPVLDNLIEITFEDCIFHLSWLSDLLQKCPKLVRLSKFECRTVNARWPINTLNLPHLKYLGLERMDFREITQHLQHLKFPSTSNLTIECNPDNSLSDTFDGINLQLLLRVSSHCEALDIGLFINEMYFETKSSINSASDASKSYVKDSLLLHWDGVGHVVSRHRWIMEILKRSNWKTASRVQLRVDADEDEVITEQMWLDLLGLLPKVTFLAVAFLGDSTRTVKEFISALGRRAPLGKPDFGFLANENDGEDFKMCPSLKHLSLKSLEYDIFISSDLRRALHLREAYQKRIESLWMYDVLGLNDDDAEKKNLKKFVDYLYWARYEDKSGESEFFDSDEQDCASVGSEDDCDDDDDGDEDENWYGDKEDESNEWDYDYFESEAEFTDGSSYKSSDHNE